MFMCFCFFFLLVVLVCITILYIFPLHLVFLLFFFFFFRFCCFDVCYFLNFGYPSKTSLNYLEIPKTPKMKSAEKRTFWQEQLAQVCSQMLSFLCFFKFCIFCWERYTNRGFSPKKGKSVQILNVKTWSKYKLNIGPSMLRNILGPVFKLCKCAFWLFLHVLKNPLLSAGRTLFLKTKMDQFLAQNRQTLDQF